MKKDYKINPIWIIKSMISRSKMRIYKYEIHLQEEKKNLKRLERSLICALKIEEKK